MKERPVMFTPANIHRIISGDKTQTRRVMQGQPYTLRSEGWGFPTRAGGFVSQKMIVDDCPYGVVGDHLYVKEGVIIHVSIPQVVGYYLDGCRVTESWESRRTAMFMPKWAARFWLEITDVRVQRLQDISEADAIAEGVYSERVITDVHCYGGRPVEEHAERFWPSKGSHGEGFEDAVSAYEALWDSINGKKHPWKSNPWVWVLQFKQLK